MKDLALMREALRVAEGIGRDVSPNPGVGAAIWTVPDGHGDEAGRLFVGNTEPPGGAHAEVMALRAAYDAGVSVEGATLATTLEPCNHHGRTGPCTEAILAAGIKRVIVGLRDPDTKVAGTGIERLRTGGCEVIEGVRSDEVEVQLRAYLHHRRTGRPFVTLKLAASLDGRTAAPDGSSQWITGIEARTDAHRLRAEHDAILVGAATIRADNPTLTVRLVDGPDPLRVVLGKAPEGATVHPCVELSGDLVEVLRELGSRDVLSVLVEGGATVAHAFHAAELVNEYVVYLAPVLFGGSDSLGLFRGSGAQTMADVWRGRINAVTHFGNDIRIDVTP
jgi:diaminohydroxyphosphoribosylaminopyrimidine deaminase / 5-amino-6-(5-phosphoribosylamino)uracil reductase